MNKDSTLSTILSTADDFSVVAEVYASDAFPPFAPADAEKRFAAIGGLTFDGEEYERRVLRFDRAVRSISKQVNTCSLELDNLDKTLSTWELDEGFEGKILVIRLISRSQSDTLAKSIILFTGRCEQAFEGTKDSLKLNASQMVGAIDNMVPRRQFTYDDAEGRVPQDATFEGFRYVPQYGTFVGTKVTRKRSWWSLWLKSREVKKFDQYSSFSDIDSNKYVPVVLGRGQLMGVNVCYADVGTYLHVVTAFCEGPVEDMTNIRTDDPRFAFYDNTSGSAGYPAMPPYYKRYGYEGGKGPTGREQEDFPLGDFEGNGYYSRTAFIFGLLKGTDNLTVDPAPGVVAVVLGQQMTIPDGGGYWDASDKWSDNPAAHTYFLLTSDDYGKLSKYWIDEESFTEAYEYNDAPLYDGSFSDQIGLPPSANYGDGTTASGQFLSSTGRMTTEYFRSLRGDSDPSDAFLRVAASRVYTDGEINTPIEDDDGDGGGTGGGGGGSSSRGRNYQLRRRYTSNVVVSDSVTVSDFLHDVVFSASQMFLSQAPDGKIKLRHKKPAPYALATAAVSSTSVTVDSIEGFTVPSTVVIDPNQTGSEVRTITAVSYSTATPTLTNDVYLGDTGDVTVTAFTGSGGATPKSATITVGHFDGTNQVVDTGYIMLTLDGVSFRNQAFDDDDPQTVAGCIAASINAHPELGRRFRAEWDPDEYTVDVKQVSGTLTLDEAPSLSHAAPLTDPTTAPACVATGTGAIGAGKVQIGYAFENSRGETRMSEVQTLDLTGNQKIKLVLPTGVSAPSGSTVNWYVTVQPLLQPMGAAMRRVTPTLDSGDWYISDLARTSASVPPVYNTTGCEVLEICTVFADKAETRSKASKSNVLMGTFKWSLGRLSQAKNWVEVQYRDASADFRVTTLNLKDDAHIAKTGRTNKHMVSGAAIDNYNQAYRIASMALAENLDANFLYQWTSDRQALLLEEGDIVAITDSGLGVVNLPVRIEQMELTMDGSFPTVSYTARKYSSSLYDDSVAERQIPVVIEQGVTNSYGG